MSASEPSVEEIRAAVAQVVSRLTGGQAGSADVESPSATGELDPVDGPLTRVAIGGDHGGYALKERLAADLRDRGLSVHDCGTRSTEPVDYPDIAHAVAALVATGECEVGIVIDGAGIGSAMAANKVPGVRAATCWDVSSARNSREHNHANVLSIGAGLLGENLAREIVDVWLSTRKGPSRHARRVAKIDAIEQHYGTRLG